MWSYSDSRDRDKRRKHSRRERQRVERSSRGEETKELEDQFESLSLRPQSATTSAPVQRQVDTVWTLCPSGCGAIDIWKLGYLLPDPPPKPQPIAPNKVSQSSRYQSDLRQWEEEYQTWKYYTCECHNAYFCKAHGQWVTGDDVRNGISPPWDQQTPHTCHRYGYFCKAHEAWVSDEEVRIQVAPTVKDQTAKTCHKNGYFCAAHNKWVPNLLIDAGHVPIENEQTTSTCHPKEIAKQYKKLPSRGHDNPHGNPAVSPSPYQSGNIAGSQYHSSHGQPSSSSYSSPPYQDSAVSPPSYSGYPLNAATSSYPTSSYATSSYPSTYSVYPSHPETQSKGQGLSHIMMSASPSSGDYYASTYSGDYPRTWTDSKATNISHAEIDTQERSSGVVNPPHTYDGTDTGSATYPTIENPEHGIENYTPEAPRNYSKKPSYFPPESSSEAQQIERKASKDSKRRSQDKSKNKSKSSKSSMQYPSPWSEWEWTEKYECYSRYRQTDTDQYEYDYRQSSTNT